MQTIAVYDGSFDPITYGHLHIIQQSLYLFDKIIIAVGINPAKKSMFNIEKRIEMIHASIQEEWKLVTSNWIHGIPDYSVESMGSNMLYDFARDRKASFLIRGIRNSIDFEYESQMQIVHHKRNLQENQNIQSVYIVPPPEKADISSSFVKGIVGYDGWESLVKNYAPPCVCSALKNLKERQA